MPRDRYIRSLQEQILQRHGCRSIHFQTVPLKETFHGRVLFDGDIEVFNLIGHPDASRAFAWCRTEDADCVVFLAIPPINTPRDAMRQYIIDEFTGHA